MRTKEKEYNKHSPSYGGPPTPLRFPLLHHRLKPKLFKREKLAFKEKKNVLAS
jgi:hypothetical protein